MPLERLGECILCHSPQIKTLCEPNRYGECAACGHVFDNPRPPWSAIVDFYSKENQYDEWLAEEPERDEMWQRRLRLILKHRRSGRLLDVGAGIGQFLKYAKKYFEVEGTEISPVAIQIASERYGIPLREGTLENNAWERPFDVLTLFHVLEHVPDPDHTIKVCRRLLGEHGLLVLAVPNDVECFLTRRNRVMRRLGFKKYQPLGELGLPALSLEGSEIHLSHFKEKVLREALEARGFEVIESGVDPYFAARGMRKLRRLRRMYTYSAIQKVSGFNLYDTIWMVARVSPSLRSAH